MKLVIDIPEEDYEKLMNGEGSINLFFTLCAVVFNGTPLPKGHGRLIDEDDIDNHIIGHVDTRSCPTIIEADKE